MGLEMKTVCKSCGAALTNDGEAYICSWECTYCPACAEQHARVCPTCGGELVRRPRRQP